MALPVVLTRATGRTSTTNVTSHPITLPAGIVAGDVLLVVFSSDQNPVVTVGAGAGWTKLDQQADGTSAVTAAIFWKVAAGSDSLTLTTSTSEQSSHVSFRLSSPGSIPQVEFAVATGSSTNSDPPLLTPVAGTQQYLFITTRSGDSTVVATVAPSGYSNLQTIAAAGTGGASTNTAEAGLVGTGNDPPAFTSANEQWVCYTLAVYDRTVSKDLIPTYGVFTSAQADFTAAFAITGATAAANYWFSRTTNGFNTWGGASAALTSVQRDLGVSYQMAGSVRVDLTAVYSVSSTSTTQPTTWFAILTNGQNTWAGGTVTNPTQGIINGDVVFPASAELSLAPVYSLVSAVIQDRVLTYQVRAAALKDLSPTYSVTSTVQQDRVATYNILAYAQVDISSNFQILTSVQADLAPTYGLFTFAQKDLAPVYTINTTPLTAGGNLALAYDIKGRAQSDLVPTYTVQGSVFQDFSPIFGVLTSAELDLEVIFQLTETPLVDLQCVYSVSGVPIASIVECRPYRPSLDLLPYRTTIRLGQ
jgi:hypothetical protein